MISKNWQSLLTVIEKTVLHWEPKFMQSIPTLGMGCYDDDNADWKIQNMLHNVALINKVLNEKSTYRKHNLERTINKLEERP